MDESPGAAFRDARKNQGKWWNDADDYKLQQHLLV